MTSNMCHPKIATVGNRLGDLSDMPSELRSILKPSLVAEIQTALVALDGIATTNELLVKVFRQTGRISTKRAIDVALHNAMRRKRIGITRQSKPLIGKVWVLT